MRYAKINIKAYCKCQDMQGKERKDGKSIYDLEKRGAVAQEAAAKSVG
jgi:hypothetical protein